MTSTPPSFEPTLPAALQQHEQFFELTQDILCIASADGHFKVVNPAFSGILGWSREELLSRPFLEFVHPDDREATLREVERQVVAGEKVLAFENRYLHKDGSWRWLSWKSAPSPGGFMNATARDVTEQRRAEEALRLSEQNLVVTLQSIGDAVLATDAQRRVTRMNPVAESLTGWPEAEALGRTVDEVFRIIHEHTREPALVPVDDVLSTGDVHGLANHTVLIARDGTERPIADSAAPIRDSVGRIVGVVLCFRDVTKESRGRALEAARGQVLERLVGAASLDEIFEVLLSHLGKLFPDHPASILLLDDAGHLRHAASTGLPGFYNEAIEGLAIGPGVGSCGEAAATGRFSVAEDVETHPNWQPYLEPARRAGLRACWSQPMIGEDARILGTLAIYSREPQSPKKRDIRLLEEIARLAALALQRRKVETALRESEERHRLLIQGSRDAMMTLHPPSWRFTSCNPAALAMFGVKDEADFHKLGPWDVSPDLQPDGQASADKARQAIETAMREGSSFFEWMHRRTDGSTFPATVLLTRMELAGQPFIQATVRDITVRKRAEEALRDHSASLERLVNERTAELAESERFTRSSLDALASHIAVLDEAGTILTTNQAWRDFAARNGLPSDQSAGGVNYLHVCDQSCAAGDADAARGATLIREVIAGRSEAAVFEYPCHSPHGQRWFLCRITRFAGDGPVRVVVAHENITERVLAEKALAESERRHRMLIANLRGMVYRCRDDADWSMEFASHGCHDLFGFAPEEFTSGHRTYASVVHPEDYPRLLRSCKAALESRLPVHIEYRVVLPSGRVKWVREQASGIYRDDGTVEAIEGFITDITERKKAEEQAASVREMFESLAAVSPAGIFRTDAKGSVDYVNRRWGELAGLESGAVLGDRWAEVIHPDDRERAVRDWTTAVGERRPLRGEYRYLRPDGSVSWVIVEAVETVDDQGRMCGYVGTTTDVTEQKQTEQALRVISTELTSLSGAPFHETVALRLASLLEVEWSFVCRWSPAQPEMLHTLAFLEDGKLLPDFSYPLAGTPCAAVPERRSLVVERGVQQRYPEDTFLVERNVEAYVGQLLTDNSGRTIGHLGIMSRKPLAQPGRVMAVLKLFAIAVAAEMERQRAHSRFVDLFEFAPDAIIMTDREGVITQANKQAEKMFGWTRGELIGRPVEVLMPASLGGKHAGFRAQFAQSAMPRAMGAGRPNLRAMRKDGSEFPVEISLSPMETEEGTMVAAAVRDITERVKSETALRASQERLKAIVENEPECVKLLDRDGCLVDMNPAGLAMIEADSLDEVRGQCIYPTVKGGADRSAFVEMVTAVFSGEHRQLIFEITSLKGTSRWLETHAVPLWDEPKKTVTALLAVTRDISGRVRTEREMRQALATLDAMDDAAFIFEPETLRFSYVNEGAVRQLGYSRDELLAMTSLDIKPGFDGPKFRDLLAPLLGGEVRTQTLITTHRHKDGRDIPVEINLQYVAFPGDRPHCICIARDITQRMMMEKQVNRSQRLEAIGTLAGGVAHDLNNVLAPILMGVEFMKLKYPGASDILDRFESSANRGAGMVRQLLTFAKGAEGERVSLQLTHLIQEVKDIMQATFPKNIHLETRFDPGLPTVLGDSTQIHQILLNLCVNARDAMPSGGTLTVEAQTVDVDATYATAVPDARPGRYVALRVHDTGMGIPSEILDRIFDPFFTTKSPEKGTGLGLSTVMGIVKGHGGFLQVVSAPGRGSTFSVHLPAELTATGSVPAYRAGTAFRGNGETILLVDDETAMLDVGCAVLTGLNFNVVTAVDGAEGLMKVVEHRSELRAIITDMHMPLMDGLAFVRTLRRVLPDIPVMIGSGRLDDPVAEELKSLNVVHRLDKPYTQDMLVTMLAALLGGGKPTGG